tara:strand:+ start:256 stop:444 length:189 start_codon:yes stop_codon:yes gene_type:complete
MINNTKNEIKRVTCNGCSYFFITHRKERPWGCKKFGFISKFIPSVEVFSTTGMECAYKNNKN